MNQLQQKFGGNNFQIIAVNVDTETADAKKLLTKISPTFTVAFDDAGAVATQYGLPTMPSSFLIGKDGKVAAVFSGFKEEEKAQIESALQKLL